MGTLAMAVVCPVCGWTSEDSAACEHCNADLRSPLRAAAPTLCPATSEGVALTPDQASALVKPESSILVTQGEQHWRVHWIDAKADPEIVEEAIERAATTLPCLAPSRVVKAESGTWVIVETTNRPIEPWKAPYNRDPLDNLQRLLLHVRALAESLEELHGAGAFWLPFDPRAIEDSSHLTSDGLLEWKLRFTNLDIGLFPIGKLPERLFVRPSFVAPESVANRDQEMGPRTDVYHLGLFCYYWLTGQLPDGFPGSGLPSFGFHLPALRIFAPGLPPGIWPVLHRALSIEPRQRFATARHFLASFEAALDRIMGRYCFEGALNWEAGMTTRAGRAKSAIGRPNEDSIFRKDFADPPRTLLAVADGISTCDVGTGALASLLTTIVLEHTFTNDAGQDAFPRLITDACVRGSRSVLDWAIEQGHREKLRQGKDLMGTTLVAAWLEGRSLRIANLGDSRAYLFDGQALEQLTVDGDLGAGLIAARTPPEQVKGLGPMAKALRECIGGCMLNAAGELIPLPDCHPTTAVWPLLPGDIVILCSDGLIEEGIFLEPEIVGEIVRTQRQRPAEEIAMALAEAADALQHEPSSLEPEGIGDNISVIVVKIGEGPPGAD